MSNDWRIKVMDAADYDQMDLFEKRLVAGFGNGTYKLYAPNANLELGKAVGGTFVTKNMTGPHFELVSQLGLVGLHAGAKSIETVDFNMLSTPARAEISSTFVGAGCGIQLAEGSVSIFSLSLGLGLSTGGGIKDDSLTFKVLGTGLTVGRKLALSVHDVEFGVDFGKLFV